MPAKPKTKRVKGKVRNNNPLPPPMHTRWKPGESGNPSGRPLELPEQKKFKNLTKKELVDVGNLVIKGDLETLKSIAKKPNATVLQIMLSAVCVKVVQKGDMHTLDILLNRLVGKVRDEVHATGSVDAKVVVTLPANGREAKAG